MCLFCSCAQVAWYRLSDVRIHHSSQTSHIIISSNCPAFRGTVPSFGPKFASLPLFHHCARFFTAFLGTNLPLDLIIFSYFYQICKNVPLLDQKSRFFKDFVPLFASGRLVGMYYDHTCMQGKCQVHVGYVLCRALVVKASKDIIHILCHAGILRW